MKSTIVICPGIHDPQLTHDFLAALHQCEPNPLFSEGVQDVLIFPAPDYPAYSAVHILEFLQRRLGLVKTPLILIGFSAGVAGAIAAAWGWQVLGGQVKAFIAFDGWGVPLHGNFPIHRVSHDLFTHWSSALLGAGEDSFYADPAVEHLELWGKPDVCQGWWIQPAANAKPEQRTFTSAAGFVIHLLERYLS